MARKWTNILVMEDELLRLRSEGKTRAEIAQALNISLIQVKNWVNRYNKRQIKGIVCPKRKGRTRKNPITKEHELELRIKELEREVKLYRDFLHAAGRM